MADVTDQNRTATSDKSGCETFIDSKIDMFSDTWGFNLDDLYKIAVIFFKEKVGSKALQITYKDKMRMVALMKQVSHGPFRADSMPDVGLFDVVGNDRKQAWQSLGNMSADDAMSEFVSFLRKMCPLFAPYVLAHFAEREEQERKRKEQDEDEQRSREEQEKQHLADAAEMQEAERQRQINQELMIRDALNKQTTVQFRQYAEQQFPGNIAQQDELIKQLQDQHYVQYMQQCYGQQLLLQQQQQQQAQQYQQQQVQVSRQVQQPTEQQKPLEAANKQPISTTTNTGSNSQVAQIILQNDNQSPKRLPNGLQKSDVADGLQTADQDDDDADENDLPPIAAANMWTRKDIKDFKDSLRNDEESVIKVGSGEIVTVRVPTHEDGSCLFWEFATDSYDIGFGVYFEWTVDTSNQVHVQISESSEDEDDDAAQKIVAGDGDAGGKGEAEVPTEEIVPPFRRDCHSEVYCGSHVYPGRGVYLLKFDNSYSLWRGKTLYYRVYYSR